LQLYNTGNILQGHNHLITGTSNPPSSDIPTPENPTPNDPDIEFPTPPLPPTDIPISSLPERISYTTDQLRKAFGFRNVDHIIPHLKQISHSNFSISSSDREPTLDLGDVSTIDRPKRNTKSNPLPKFFGNTT